MTSILSSMEREEKERQRQLEAIREYNRLKKAIFESRMDKFLKLYPYKSNEQECITEFARVVESADEKLLKKIIVRYNAEKKYWSTYYVLHTCNESIYQHIMSVMKSMRDCLDQKIQSAKFEKEEDEIENEIEDEKEDNIENGKEDDHGIIAEWGAMGEKEVEYVLKWLTDDYYVIEKDCTSKYTNRCILLENQTFIDESQEYDHIVVGPQGVFLIETKNYSGQLHIDHQGNWLRKKKREEEWLPEINPGQQVVRHHVLMESIVGKEVPIIDVICLAHPNIMTSGLENANIPVIKKDQLGDFIMRYQGELMDKAAINEVVCKINRHKISKKNLAV